MDRFMLPQGEAAALMPEAVYSIPGLFLYSGLVYQCLDQVEAKCGWRIPVRSLYGSPQVLWNGGRVLFKDHGPTLEIVEKELRGAAERGILPLLTFSATHMTEEWLKDRRCNDIMAVLDEVKGGVIVADPMLRRHIEKNYPDVTIHMSVILASFARKEERTPAFYQALSQRGSQYVIHPDDNFDLDLLSKVPKENATLLINERCGFGCPQRAEHFRSTTDDMAKIMAGDMGNLSRFLDRCPFTPDRKQANMKERNETLSVKEVVELYKMGFRTFKLQGRMDIPYVFFFDFLRFALEPEAAFPGVYPIFAYSILEYEKEKAKRRRAENG